MQKQIRQSIIVVLLAMLLVATAGCSLPGVSPAATVAIDRQAQETLLATIDYEPISLLATDKSAWIPYSLTISPDNRRIAYVVHTEKGLLVVVDGKEGPAYRDIASGSLVFSNDSKHFAYVATSEDRKWFVVVNGKEGKRCDGILPFILRFNPDSQKEMYIAKVDNKYFLQVGDSEGTSYDKIQGSLSVSADGKRIAYAAAKANTWFVVDNGKPGKQYEMVIGDYISFSPDGQKMAYGAVSKADSFVVLDGVENKPYKEIYLDNRGFTPDSRRFAYIASTGTQGLVVLDGKELKLYRGIGAGSLSFSPDSRRLAYIAQLKGQDEPAAGKEKDPKAPQVKDEVCVVVDEQQGKIYNVIGGSPVFSPDGQHVAYFVQEKDGWFPVIDQQEYKQKLYKDIAQGSFTFSADGKHTAFSALSDGKWSMIVDGKEGKVYDGVVAPPGTRVDFDATNTLRYIAMGGNKVYLVEEKITEISAKP